MFEPIDRFENNNPNLYEKIIRSIREMMLSGELKVGEKIPPERELADLFKVSRVPIREALKTLEFLGVIQNVRGDGMYIQNISIEELLDKMAFAIENTENTIEELFIVREILENKASRLAALNRTEKDIEKLKKTIAEMESKIEEGKDVYKLSLRFHTLIFEAARNKVLLGINDYLMGLLEVSREKTLFSSGHRKTALDFHKQILENIIKKDSEEAARIMDEHLKDAYTEYSLQKK